MVNSNAIEQYYGFDGGIRESIKTLRSNIQFAGIDTPIRTITVTSVLPNEGKSFVSIALAISMAEAGKRTLLVESDFRRPSLSGRLRVRAEVGLMQYLSSSISLENAVIPTSRDGLYLLDLETRSANPAEILSSQRFSQAIAEMRERFDIVIFDTPPLGSFIDAAILGAQSDGTILVTQSGACDISSVKRVLDQLEKAKAKVLGVVLNKTKQRTDSDYYYYYYSKSGEASDKEHGSGNNKRHRQK